MQHPQAKLAQIRRILALWPSQAADDGDELLRGYLLAAEDYPAQDVEAAVDTLVKGVAPGVNPSFRPKPSELGAESHRQNYLRAERAERERRHRPALPPPEIERTPEAQARVKDLMKETVANLQSADLEDGKARHKASIDRANAYFDPPRGFSIGDQDGDRDVA